MDIIGNKISRERILSANTLDNECSRIQGVKVPGSELSRVLLADSFLGANWRGSGKAVNHYVNT